MDRSTRRLVKTSFLALTIAMAAGFQVCSTFNRIVVPDRPINVIRLENRDTPAPSLVFLGTAVELPVGQIKEGWQNASERLHRQLAGLPLKEIQMTMISEGQKAREQLKTWWNDTIRQNRWEDLANWDPANKERQ